MLIWTRLKKRWLERRLLNRRVNVLTGDRVVIKSSRKGRTKSNVELDSNRNRLLKKLFRSMTVDELDSLWMAIRSRGTYISDCIMVPRTFDSMKASEMALADMTLLDSSILCFGAFLAPHMETVDLARRMIPLSWCRNSGVEFDYDQFSVTNLDGKSVCCNPYHYGLLAMDDPSASVADTVTTNIQQSQESFRLHGATEGDKIITEFAESYSDDTGFISETSGTLAYAALNERDLSTDKTSLKGPKPWCHIAYWEENGRLGPILSATDNIAFVYFNTLKPQPQLMRCNLRIASVCQNDCSDSVRKTRSRIGLGFALFRRENRVWLYNRSGHCIFVRSNTCFRNRDRPLRLGPGYCCIVHRIGCAVSRNAKDPKESPTVLISFVKGWGTSYIRPVITSCPCWVQVIFPA